MEADWSAEVGGDAPVIDADWSGFVDLRCNPEAVQGIAEAPEGSVLREVLLLLNARGTRVFTSKCDVWGLAPDEMDPFEYDFSPAEKPVGVAAWIDVIAEDAALFQSFERQQEWVRCVVERLRAEPVRSGRGDLVIRAAHAGGADGFGVTLYAAGCGMDDAAARLAWEMVLRAAVDVTIDQALRASSSIG